jgi:spore coat polysaccharide biosynthesis protein SpsF
MPKKIVIMQARMQSTRLHGKIMKKICDKTILEHDILRVSKSKTIDEIIIATSDDPADEVIAQEAYKLGIKFFRGSETDVLSRYYFVANEHNADIIIRITSDCPLYDWQVLDDMVDYFTNKDFDYLCNFLARTYPRGLETEIFTFDSLEKAHFKAKLDHEREHVTPYIWQNPSLFKLGNYKAKVNNSQHRWTLDTEADFSLINTIYNHLYPKNNYFTTNDILELFEANPNLFYINSHIEQKKL